jgi:hypothetical protein
VEMENENVYVSGKLIGGIDGVIAGDNVNIASSTTEMIISNGIITQKINNSDVLGVKMVNDVQIQEQYVSSIGGAVLGGALFGVAGAAVGGRAKKKQIKTNETSLVITYKDNETVKNIIIKPSQFVSFKFLDRYTRQIELDPATKQAMKNENKGKKGGCLLIIILLIVCLMLLVVGLTLK